VTAWLGAFALTQIVEVPIYLRALLARDDPDRPFDRLLPALLVGFGASAITHPIVWFVMPQLIPNDYVLMVAVAETFAVLAEAAWLRAFGLRRALLWALFCNAASVLVGLTLRHTFGWP
jgi:hypothetical protein